MKTTDFVWAVDVDATSYEVGKVEDIGLDNVVALFVNEQDAKIFAEIKNFARYSGNK